MDEFCQSKFWDANLTWYTSSPDFTNCFQNTVLVWIPCGFIWLFLFMELNSYYTSARRHIPRSNLNRLRTILVCFLVFLQFVNAIKLISQSMLYSVESLACGVKLFTYVLVLWLTLNVPKYGIRTSGVQFMFWVLCATCGLIIFRSNIMSYKMSNKKAFTSLTFFIEYPVVVVMFALSFISDKKATYTLQKDGQVSLNKSPIEEASFFSQLIYHWLERLLWKGYKNPLTVKDLYNLQPEIQTSVATEHLERFFKSDIQENINRTSSDDLKQLENNESFELVELFPKHPIKSENHYQNISFALFRAFGPRLIFPYFIELISSLLIFPSTYIMKLLIEFASSDEPTWKGVFYACLLLILEVVRQMGLEYRFRISTDVTRCLISSTMSCLYKKSLRLSSSARQELSVGHLVNCMTVDAHRFNSIMNGVQLLWLAPIQIIISSIYLYSILGVSAFAGIILMVFSIPFLYFCSRFRKTSQVTLMTLKDKRIKLINENLNEVRVLKLYAWEMSFQKKIEEIRNKETASLKKVAYVLGFHITIFNNGFILATLISFSVYILSNDSNILTPATAFVSLRLFNLLNAPVASFGEQIINLILQYVSLERITKVLNSDEIKDYVNDSNENFINPDTVVQILDASFTWNSESEPTLRNINFEVRKGSLVAVLGQIGSGKSSLLAAILGDMEKLYGNVKVQGSVGYVPQQPWIQNATLKKNILFYHFFEASKYENIIEACALGDDIDILPAYDETEIGEKGINLSEGQKQRLSLARSVYMDNDIYLLDDTLGSVDSHTSQHIFQHVLGPNGLLKNKTRILVTHNVACLSEVDEIFFMTDGKIEKLGSFQDIMSRDDNFKTFVMSHTLDESQDWQLNHIYDENFVGNSNKANNIAKWKSVKKDSITNVSENNERNDTINTKEGENIIETENLVKGKIAWSVWTKYIKSAGWFWGVIVSVSTLLSAIMFMSSTYWISLWSDKAEYLIESHSTSTSQLAVFGTLSGINIIAAVISAISIGLGTLAATMKMHSVLIRKVLQIPLSLFDTTPIGRILNHFSKDVQEMDESIPQMLTFSVSLFTQVIAVILTTSLVLPTFIPGVVVCLVILYITQRFYSRTSRQLKRIIGTTSSPLFTHFSDSLAGANIIRAMRATDTFIQETYQLIDRNGSALYLMTLTMRWMQLRLLLLASLLMFAAALCCVLKRDSLSSGLTGFVLYNFNFLTLSIVHCFYLLSTLETGTKALERIFEYFDLESEVPWNKMNSKLSSTWPSQGKIIFWNYCARYQKGLDLALKDISFVVNPMEKVGVVGRTGAGKSSMALALSRMIEAASGEIIIDDIRIADLGLHDLRSKLSIIPQDPVLFSGTLRLNLDPFDRYTEHEIWTALENSQLKPFIETFEMGLDYVINEGGQNLSVGQRQLICLARALLKQSKILILDEATASVDLETDDLIQETIKREFKFCTVVTIANRINTILDYDRILVLHEGMVMEYDSPNMLLSSTSSMFYGLAKDAGVV